MPLGNPQDTPKDYYFEVGERNIPGREFVHKYGRNPNIPNNPGTFEAIWNGGGDYTGFNATAAETIEVFSSVAADAGTLVSSGTATDGSLTTLVDTGATFVSDGVAVGDIILNDTRLFHGVVSEVTSETVLTVIRFNEEGTAVGGDISAGDLYRVASPASTGASVIEIQFLLDGDLSNETAEFIILDGTTAVDSVGTYMRCSKANALNAGSGGVNAGTITVRQKTTTANIFAAIPIGYNNTMICAYTVPLEAEGHLLSVGATLAGKTQANCNIRILLRHVGEVFTVREEFAISGTANSYVPREFKVPKNDIPGGSDIKIMADSDTNNTAVAAYFDLILSTE